MHAPTDAFVPLAVNGERLWQRLMALAQFGALPDGGVNRQALSAEEIDTWRQMLAWAADAGIEGACDDAGNLFLTLPGHDRRLPPLLMGSHLDSQPTGGRFDGVYGVMSALEVLQTLAEHGTACGRDVVAVGWMNEEGSRFAPGMMGSQAFAGVMPLDAIRAVRDAQDVSVGDALDIVQGAFPSLPRRPLGFAAAGYVELHIEQGPVLEAKDCTIGIVTGIQGKTTWRITLHGEPGHAGTVAMRHRRDAVTAFARIADRLAIEVGDHDDDVKLTLGRVTVEPNAPSVIPERVTFSVDLRHPENAVLDALGDRLEAICKTYAGPCAVDIVRLVDAPSNDFDPDWQSLIGQAAVAHGHDAMPILSTAGHDARYLAQVCPSAMIFIPSRAGISHAPTEWSTPGQVSAGANVMAEAVARWLAKDIARSTREHLHTASSAEEPIR